MGFQSGQDNQAKFYTSDALVYYDQSDVAHREKLVRAIPIQLRRLLQLDTAVVLWPQALTFLTKNDYTHSIFFGFKFRSKLSR